MTIKPVRMVLFAAALVAASCDLPYTPSREPLPGGDIGGGDAITAGAGVFGVNPQIQICNPSVSQDTARYRGCMLFLNFSGELKVNKGEFADYDTIRAGQHDRLTVVDTSNTVRWFVKNSHFGLSNELQDPEWSNHRDYIAFLGGVGSGPNAKFYGYAVRLSDKQYIKLTNIHIGGESTPFVWLPDSTPLPPAGDTALSYLENGFADAASVRQFFGTTYVKFVYAKKENFLHLYFVDYSADVVAPVALPVPEGRELWNCESPLVSSDGRWVVYNCYENDTRYEVYAQRLRARSTPILISGNGSDPHWWTHPDDPSLLYVVYQTCKSNFVQENLADATILASGQAGRTWKQRVYTAPGDRATHALFELIDEPTLLINLPFKGGLSRDGSFLCTGYANGFIARLE